MTCYHELSKHVYVLLYTTFTEDGNYFIIFNVIHDSDIETVLHVVFEQVVWGRVISCAVIFA